jgi:toxin HigB-1
VVVQGVGEVRPCDPRVLDVAVSLKDISPLRSVGLHKLKHDRAGQWAMTVNDRWRICFRF